MENEKMVKKYKKNGKLGCPLKASKLKSKKEIDIKKMKEESFLGSEKKKKLVPNINIRGIYDNGGKTADRYTIITNNNIDYPNGKSYKESLSVGENPSNFSQWGEAIEGRHLGKKIKFDQLPLNVQEHINKRMKE